MTIGGDIEALIPGLRRYARALTGNASTADDLVQDCLERALSRLGIHPASEHAHLVGWLWAPHCRCPA